MSVTSGRLYPPDAVPEDVPRQHVATAISPTNIFLFLAIAAYCACPIINIPLVSLSFSAPLFLWIAKDIFLRPRESWGYRYRVWIGFAFAIWCGILISVVCNVWLDQDHELDNQSLLAAIQYTYWLLFFVASAYVVFSGRLGARLVNVLAWAVFAVGLLRWSEVIDIGNLGAWKKMLFMTQNDYGWLFSTFSPCLLAAIESHRGGRRRLLILATLVVWGAAAINGSRSSWITMPIGLLLYLGIRIAANPARITELGWLVVLITGAGIASVVAPPEVVEPVVARFSTFGKLDQDKSYEIRNLMTQKGWRLFLETPVFGVGAGRFRLVSTDLAIPRLLRYANQAHFDKKSSHNSYASYLAETGLAGAIPYAILLLALLFSGARAAVRLAREGQVWASGLFACFVGMSIHLWSLAGLQNTATWLVYGALAGAIMTAGETTAVPSRRVSRHPNAG
jgi:O-antigen ligase